MERYLLTCGHRCFHGVCFRNYCCVTAEKFKCPLCGELQRARRTKKLKNELMAKEYMSG
jgi:hypothetical protein